MAFSLENIFGSLGKTGKKTVGGSVLGIDIGGSSVKVVEIEETPRTIMLRTYGELQLGPYENKPLGDIVSLPDQKKVEAVSDVMREAGVASRRGSLAIPLSSSFLTVVPINVTPQTDIAAVIPVEARKYVPLPLTDVSLDWTELPPVGEQKTNIKEILLAAIENEALAQHRALLTSIGMVGEATEIEAFGLIRSVWRQKDTTVAIIDFGARSSKLYIVRNGILERTHRVAVGGREITKRVADALKLEFEAAENQKRSYDRASEMGATIFQIMSTVIEGPLIEFGQLIGQYEARLGSQIGRVVLSGGVAASPYALEYVKDRFARPVEISDPFAKVAYPAFMEDTLKNIGPSFGVALGAALSKFQ